MGVPVKSRLQDRLDDLVEAFNAPSFGTRLRRCVHHGSIRCIQQASFGRNCRGTSGQASKVAWVSRERWVFTRSALSTPARAG
jgi:hypothetical protein